MGVLLLGQACTVKKYLPAGTYLLDKVNVKGAPANTKDELYNLSKQVPNKKILGFWKINMWSYLLANKNKIRKNKEDRLKRLQSRYEDKEKALQQTNANSRKGRKLKKQVAALQVKIDNQRNKIDDLKKSIWEEPVLLDTALCKISAAQMQASLFNNGYFHDTVSYVVTYQEKKKKAAVTYIVTPRDAFFIKSIDYYIFDKRIAGIVAKDTLNSLVHPNMRYDGEVLTRERDRLTLLMRENGYYNFSREFIYFEVDSTMPGNFVNVGIGIANPSNQERHRVYMIRKIYMEPEFVLGDSTVKDSIRYGDITFLTNRKLIVRKQTLASFVYFRTGRLYRNTDHQRTISKLSQLPLFRFIDIQYTADTSMAGDTGQLDVLIRLSPAGKYDYTYNLELNSTEESLAQIQNSTTRSMGAATSIAFRDKNFINDGLTLQFSPQAALEIPISLLQNTRIIDTPNIIYGFNTSLIFPQLLLPKWLKEKYARRNTQTALNVDFLHEENKFYYRATINTNLTYLFSHRNIRQYVTPFEISIVDAKFRSRNFGDRVKATGDPLLINLFNQHIITDFRYVFLYNQQPLVLVKKPLFFFREAAEMGGMLPYLISLAAGSPSNSDIITGNTIKGINYFKYLKSESDFRYYIPVGKETNLAFRSIFGIGAPVFKSSILPFEKRFLAGGANSIRAWKLRQVGPGSFYSNDPSISFDHSGDIKLEFNSELRFPIYGVFKGALFLDAGNVWLFKNDPDRPGAEFEYNRFYKEIAVGTGLGTRFDFSVFLFRLDFGVKLRDPAQPETQRWLFNKMGESDWIGNFMNLNLGIGYPF
jgi:hypothetical protein